MLINPDKLRDERWLLEERFFFSEGWWTWSVDRELYREKDKQERKRRLRDIPLITLIEGTVFFSFSFLCLLYVVFSLLALIIGWLI